VMLRSSVRREAFMFGESILLWGKDGELGAIVQFAILRLTVTCAIRGLA